VPGCAVYDEETGAVLYKGKTRELTREQCREVIAACPYNVPRRDSATGLLAKCDMCIDQVRAKSLPLCVQVCARGAMNFGERRDMLRLGRERLAELENVYSQAQLLDQEQVAVIYLVADDPRKYHKFAVAQVTSTMARKEFFARCSLRPCPGRV
jgi:formate dehydrogenase iron-sulfur subunit